MLEHGDVLKLVCILYGFFKEKNYGCLQKLKNVETTKQIFCNKINTTCTTKVTIKKLGKKKKRRL